MIHARKEYSFVTGPALYIQKENALLDAGSKVAFLGKKALVLCDAFVKDAFYPELRDSLGKSSVENECFVFAGECTYEESGRVYDFAKDKGFDFLVGFGGGKALDTVKLAGLQLNLPWVLISTSAATCAAWTAVAIVYNANGTFRDIVDTGRAPVVTIVDETAVLKGPKELLIAGAGDTYAKYHEAKHVSAFKDVEKDLMAVVALETSEKMYAILKKEAPEVKELIFANIALSGFVSTAGRNATSALYAHAFANAVLVVNGAKKILHGNLAALGLVFEFLMLNVEFPETLVFKSRGLPLSFKDLGLNPTPHELASMVELIKKDDSVDYFYPKVELESILKVLRTIM